MAKLFDMENKYSIIIISMVGVFVILVVLAVIFSNIRFEEKIDGTVATVINDGDLIINYVDGDNVEINDSKEHKYAVSITNSGSSKIYYSIYFNSANTDAEVKISDYEGNEINKVNKDIVSSKLINLYSIEGGETLRYSIDIKSKVRFKGTLKVVNESLTTDTFSDLILLHNNIQVPKTRIGEEIATQDEGLISTMDNKGPSYYFRGAVSNNYVKLGDNVFRVVRINGDSTVRLVLDGVLENQQSYNTNELQPEHEASELALLNNSSILAILNTWVEENLQEYSTYITTGDYCTDTIFNNNVNDINYSSSYTRNFVDKESSLHCSGTIYTGSVGLLTADEIVLAGAATNIPNSKYYLYNKNIPGNYVTNSSYSINTANVLSMINVMSNGAFGDGILINNPSYIRPVINISISAKVKGNGTIDDPYIIVS